MCSHEHVVIQTTGTLGLYEGDVSDTIATRWVCVDCGQTWGEDETPTSERTASEDVPCLP